MRTVSLMCCIAVHVESSVRPKAHQESGGNTSKYLKDVERYVEIHSRLSIL